MPDYRAVWEIEDPWASTREMKEFALTELYGWLDDAGYCQNGPIVWTRTTNDLVAELPVIVEDSPVGDARPWMSRQGLADELCDQVAA